MFCCVSTRNVQPYRQSLEVQAGQGLCFFLVRTGWNVLQNVWRIFFTLREDFQKSSFSKVIKQLCLIPNIQCGILNHTSHVLPHSSRWFYSYVNANFADAGLTLQDFFNQSGIKAARKLLTTLLNAALKLSWDDLNYNRAQEKCVSMPFSIAG